MIPSSIPPASYHASFQLSAQTFSSTSRRPSDASSQSTLADVAGRRGVIPAEIDAMDPSSSTLAEAPPPQYSLPDAVRASSTSRRGDTIIPADSIADLIGVDSHFGYRNSPYMTVPAIRSLLLSSGIRHVRDSDASWFRHNSISTNITTTPTQLEALRADNPNADFVELCGNESDNTHDPSWPQTVRSCVQQQAPLVRNWGIPVVAPSLAKINSALALGNLNSYVDYANVHYGVCGDNPGTIRYKPLSQAADLITQVAPRYFVTEFSYNNYVRGGEPYQTRPCAIPAPIVSAYYVRAAFEWLNLGATRLYYYQLADMPGDNMFGGEGIIDASGTPKPQYGALKNLISLYSDPGAHFVPKQVAFSISAPSVVHHVVAEKRNGTILLAVYREQTDFDWQKQQAIDVPIAPASVSVPGYRATIMHVWRPDGSLITRSASTTVKLGIYPVVIEFEPR